MDCERLAKLSEGQRECLRMVLRHMSSKEIARALNISRHTVDQRLRMAMTVLGASSRVEAARRFAQAEGAGGYQRFAYQPPPLEADPGRAAPQSPAPREERGHERLHRFGWIVAIAAGAVMFVAAVFTALNALSQFTR
jgi:DNA-binding CsgD family transcriptional regulator